jgi:Sec-independent protein translocase protein TatA
MFGVSLQELLIIVLLLLVVFGPGKAVGMARDLGRFANTARDQVEEFKDELLHDGDEDDHDGSKS